MVLLSVAALSGCGVSPMWTGTDQPSAPSPVDTYAAEKQAEALAATRVRLMDPCSVIDQQRLSAIFGPVEVLLDDFDVCTVRLGDKPLTDQPQLRIRPMAVAAGSRPSGVPKTVGNKTFHLEAGVGCDIEMPVDPWIRFGVDVNDPTATNDADVCMLAESLLPALGDPADHPPGLYPVREIDPCDFVRALEPGLGQGPLTGVRPSSGPGTDCSAQAGDAELTVDLSLDLARKHKLGNPGVRLFDLDGHPASELVLPPDLGGDNTCLIAWNVGTPVLAAENPKRLPKFQTVTVQLNPTDDTALPPCKELNAAVPAAAALVRG